MNKVKAIFWGENTGKGLGHDLSQTQTWVPMSTPVVYIWAAPSSVPQLRLYNAKTDH